MRWRVRSRERMRSVPLSIENRRRRDRDALNSIARDLEALLDELGALARSSSEHAPLSRSLLPPGNAIW